MAVSLQLPLAAARRSRVAPPRRSAAPRAAAAEAAEAAEALDAPSVLSAISLWKDAARPQAPLKRLQTQTAVVAQGTTVIRSLDFDRRVSLSVLLLRVGACADAPSLGCAEVRVGTADAAPLLFVCSD